MGEVALEHEFSFEKGSVWLHPYRAARDDSRGPAAKARVMMLDAEEDECSHERQQRVGMAHY